MNQNLLNYFQNRQAQPSSVPNESQMPGREYEQNAMHAPEAEYAQEQTSPYQQPAAHYNPFNQGIKMAMEASRGTLAPSAEQTDKAMRAGMLAFAEAMRNAPKDRGFAANASSIGQALSPALASYDASSNQSEMENQALANQILAYQNNERKWQRDQGHEAWNRDYKERELEERKNNHLFHNFMRGAKGNRNQVDANGEAIDPNYAYIQGMPFKKLDNIGLRHAQENKAETARANHEIQEMYKTWNKLEDKTKDNYFAPLGGWSGVTNTVKDLAGRYLGSESLKEETALRQNLEAQLGQLTIALERAKTGKGVTQGMYDRLRNYYPNKNDDIPTLKLKLQTIKEEGELFAEAAALSDQYGANITIDDVKKLKEMSVRGSSGETSPSSQESVMMIGPDGSSYNIPASELQDAMSSGFKVIEN